MNYEERDLKVVLVGMTNVGKTCISQKATSGIFNEKNTAAAIRIHNDRLYVSNRGHNSIAVFKINGKELVLEEIFSCGGEGPRDFDIFEDVLSRRKGVSFVWLKE